MSDGTFNRPRSQLEPRAHDERGRAFGGTQSRGPDQAAADRRDSGPDALLELARLIGESDPFAPVPGRSKEAPKPDQRVVDAPRGAIAPDRGVEDPSIRPPTRYPTQPQDRSARPLEDRSSLDGAAPARRPPQPPTHPDAEPTDEDFDFLQLSGRSEYPVVPRQAQADDRDYGRDDHHEELLMSQPHPARGQHDEYDEYLDDDREQDHDYEPDYEYEADQEPTGDGESAFKRRSTTKIVIAVLGLAVCGSAAAFGYRTIFKAASSGPPPIIRADTSPTRVMPVGADAGQKSI